MTVEAVAVLVPRNPIWSRGPGQTLPTWAIACVDAPTQGKADSVINCGATDGSLLDVAQVTGTTTRLQLLANVNHLAPVHLGRHRVQPHPDVRVDYQQDGRVISARQLSVILTGDKNVFARNDSDVVRVDVHCLQSLPRDLTDALRERTRITGRIAPWVVPTAVDLHRRDATPTGDDLLPLVETEHEAVQLARHFSRTRQFELPLYDLVNSQSHLKQLTGPVLRLDIHSLGSVQSVYVLLDAKPARPTHRSRTKDHTRTTDSLYLRDGEGRHLGADPPRKHPPTLVERISQAERDGDDRRLAYYGSLAVAAPVLLTLPTLLYLSGGPDDADGNAVAGLPPTDLAKELKLRARVEQAARLGLYVPEAVTVLAGGTWKSRTKPQTDTDGKIANILAVTEGLTEERLGMKKANDHTPAALLPAQVQRLVDDGKINRQDLLEQLPDGFFPLRHHGRVRLRYTTTSVKGAQR